MAQGCDRMKLQPLDLEEIEKMLDMIAIVGEDFSEEGADEVLRLRKQKFMQELKQGLKSACEFYLQYKDKPELLSKEQPEIAKKFDGIGLPHGDTIYVFLTHYNDWLFKLVFKSVLEDDVEDETNENMQEL